METQRHTFMRQFFVCALAAVAGACALPPVPAIEHRVELVETSQLLAYVAALCAIGPRPAGDAAVPRT